MKMGFAQQTVCVSKVLAYPVKVRPVGFDSVLVCESVHSSRGSSAEHFVSQLIYGERWGDDVTLTGREAHVTIHI